MAGIRIDSNDGIQFWSYVADKTGLDIRVVQAWMLAEGGPADNPLNIGPGRHYGSSLGAAKATVNLLRNPRYGPILKTAHGKPAQQIAAIVASPWDAGHYRGGSSKDGTLLQGTYQRILHGGGIQHSGGVVGAAGAAGTAVHHAEQSAAAAVTGIPGAIAGIENFILKESVVGLSYLLLTAAALAFFVLGALRATGTSPAELARATPTKGAIPY